MTSKYEQFDNLQKVLSSTDTSRKELLSDLKGLSRGAVPTKGFQSALRDFQHLQPEHSLSIEKVRTDLQTRANTFEATVQTLLDADKDTHKQGYWWSERKILGIFPTKGSRLRRALKEALVDNEPLVFNPNATAYEKAQEYFSKGKYYSSFDMGVQAIQEQFRKRDLSAEDFQQLRDLMQKLEMNLLVKDNYIGDHIAEILFLIDAEQAQRQFERQILPRPLEYTGMLIDGIHAGRKALPTERSQQIFTNLTHQWFQLTGPITSTKVSPVLLQQEAPCETLTTAPTKYQDGDRLVSQELWQNPERIKKLETDGSEGLSWFYRQMIFLMRHALEKFKTLMLDEDKANLNNFIRQHGQKTKVDLLVEWSDSEDGGESEAPHLSHN